MSITDELLQNNEGHAEPFDKGSLPLPPASARRRPVQQPENPTMRSAGRAVGSAPFSPAMGILCVAHFTARFASSQAPPRRVRISAALGFEGEVCSNGLWLGRKLAGSKEKAST